MYKRQPSSLTNSYRKSTICPVSSRTAQRVAMPSSMASKVSRSRASAAPSFCSASFCVVRSTNETLVSFVDLTTQNLAEQKLAAAEARLRETFDAMLEGMATLCAVRDEGGQIVDFRYELVNDEGCRLNLMRRDQLVGHLLCEVLPGHRESGLFDEYVQVTETRQPLQKTSLSVRDEWGTGHSMTRVFDVRAVASRDGLAASWREVTDDVRAHHALADSERRYRQMLEATQEGVLVSDVDGMTTYVNPRMAAMLGYPVQEMVGTPVWNLISNESTPAAAAGLEACRAGVAGIYQLQLCRKDGSTLWAVVTASPITDSQGNYTGALVMILSLIHISEPTRRTPIS